MIGRSSRLGDRIVKLEAGHKNTGSSDLFLIWGKNAADLERKLQRAKASGDLKAGDRYSANVWPGSNEEPVSRRTSIFAMFLKNHEDHEFEAWVEASGLKLLDPGNHTDLTSYSSEDLCAVLASGLPRAGLCDSGSGKGRP
jgi:hypothetical protein